MKFLFDAKKIETKDNYLGESVFEWRPKKTENIGRLSELLRKETVEISEGKFFAPNVLHTYVDTIIMYQKNETKYALACLKTLQHYYEKEKLRPYPACHACSPLINFFLFKKTKSGWALTSNKKKDWIINLSSFNSSPNYTLIQIGSETVCLQTEYTDGNMGFFESYINFFVLDFDIKPIFWYTAWTTYDQWDCDYLTEIRFLTNNKKFPDIEKTKYKECQDSIFSDIIEKEIFIYSNMELEYIQSNK